MNTLVTKSSEETKKFAKTLAADFKRGGIVALSGKLGSGKTTFAQGFAKGLGIKGKIISPTFLIIRQYKIPKQTNFFYHVDLYRLENISLKALGLEEIFQDPTNVVLIEWAEKIGNHLPKSVKRIGLRRISNDLHEIRF